MWPMLLDYEREECKRLLRKLELEAYASVVSAFRAQGELSKEKKKMLQDLASSLGISIERHRAEIRRAVNDEELNTIADRLSGANTFSEWATEGRRVIPLMPRLVPQTSFTVLANNVANAQAAKHSHSSSSSSSSSQVLSTTIKEEPSISTPATQVTTSPTTSTTVSTSSPGATSSLSSSATSSSILTSSSEASTSQACSSITKENAAVVPAPSSAAPITSSTPKGEKESCISEEAAVPPKKFFRSISLDASSPTRPPTPSSTSLPSQTVAIPPKTAIVSAAPTRTFSLPMGAAPVRLTLTSHRPSMTSSGPTPTTLSSSSPQRAHHKTAVLVASTSTPQASQATTTVAPSVTTEYVIKTMASSTCPTSSLKPPLITSTVARAPGLAAKPKTNQQATVQLPSKAILQAHNPFPMKQIGVKIITQNLSGMSKLLPKTTTTTITPRVVATTGTRPSSPRPPSPRVNIHAPNAPPPAGTALKVTLPPGATALSRPSTPGGAKPNVIVVHKAQVWPNPVVVQSSAATMQEAMSLLQRGATEGRQQNVSLVRAASLTSSPSPSSESPTSSETPASDAKEVDKKSTLLADIIQASGIMPSEDKKSSQDSKSSGSNGSNNGGSSGSSASTPTEEAMPTPASTTSKKKEFINLEHFQEGQILEIDSGASTSEVLHLLQKAGLQIHQVMVPQPSPSGGSQKVVVVNPSSLMTSLPMSDKAPAYTTLSNSKKRLEEDSFPQQTSNTATGLQELVNDVLAISSSRPPAPTAPNIPSPSQPKGTKDPPLSSDGSSKADQPPIPENVNQTKDSSSKPPQQNEPSSESGTDLKASPSTQSKEASAGAIFESSTLHLLEEVLQILGPTKETQTANSNSSTTPNGAAVINGAAEALDEGEVANSLSSTLKRQAQEDSYHWWIDNAVDLVHRLLSYSKSPDSPPLLDSIAPSGQNTSSTRSPRLMLENVLSNLENDRYLSLETFHADMMNLKQKWEPSPAAADLFDFYTREYHQVKSNPKRTKIS